MSESHRHDATPGVDYRLAKALGVLAITASAVSAEYGSGINYVSVQSLSVYPDVKGLVPLAMFVCGIAMLGKAKSPGKKINYFECLNCNLVIDYSGPQSRDRQEN